VQQFPAAECDGAPAVPESVAVPQQSQAQPLVKEEEVAVLHRYIQHRLPAAGLHLPGLFRQHPVYVRSVVHRPGKDRPRTGAQGQTTGIHYNQAVGSK